MHSDKALSLIDSIYSAASNPSLWPDTAHKIQHAIGGHSVNLGLEDMQNPRFSYLYTNGVTLDQVTDYERNFIANDEINALTDLLAPGQALLSHDHFCESELHTLYPYDDFYEGIGFTYFNTGMFYRTANYRGWLSVARSVNDSLFEPDDLKLMQIIMPHLKRAFTINLQLMDAQNISQMGVDSLEHISAGVVLLSHNGDVLKHNSQAEPYLHPSNEKSQSYKIQLSDTRATHQLHKIIRATLFDESNEYSGVIRFNENGIQKCILCFPWRTTGQQLDWLGQSAGCILFILSPSASSPPDQQLQQLFDLTKAEVRVLQGLLYGTTVKPLADELFVTEATIRFHLRNMLRKTGSRNQAEMLMKVMKLVSVLVS
ncbi:helix-turn-helix transcriptional regulator [Amphritea pacifica]|uniref:Helix-turn-helix transcriptional regulator n=1 Tax=Amphritea pacifica TaxID=2811233 RepID=A0ABS2WAD0_9GAMM|nr:helix-turn-helix transcriptional regulator [Amphritea pacifica]MBN0988685.1 helix-turn-helix transcriptional regulator [Amphritea pacifica]